MVLAIDSSQIYGKVPYWMESSDDELISILSQTKDPNAVQPHLRKCFEAVQKITMSGAEHEMSEMVSAEKEQVPFLNPLYPRGSVEVWMGEIETMMRKSVRTATRLEHQAHHTRRAPHHSPRSSLHSRCARSPRRAYNSTRRRSAATSCLATRRWWCSR